LLKCNKKAIIIGEMMMAFFVQREKSLIVDFLKIRKEEK
jgi:hypothetical protein